MSQSGAWLPPVAKAKFVPTVISLTIRVRSTGEAFPIQVCATDYVHALKYRIFQTIKAYTVPRQTLVSQQRTADVLLRDDTTLLMNNVFDGSQIYLLLADVVPGSFLRWINAPATQPDQYKPPTPFSRPCGIIIDASRDRVLIADWATHSVTALQLPSLELAWQYSGLAAPADVSAVSDGGSSVGVVTGAESTLLRHPRGIALSIDSRRVLVTDAGNDRLTALWADDGELDATWDRASVTRADLSRPAGVVEVALPPAGRWIALSRPVSAANDAMDVASASSASAVSDSMPLAEDDDGPDTRRRLLWVTDQENHRVVAFRTAHGGWPSDPWSGDLGSDSDDAHRRELLAVDCSDPNERFGVGGVFQRAPRAGAQIGLARQAGREDARLDRPSGIVLHAASHTLLISDHNNHRVMAYCALTGARRPRLDIGAKRAVTAADGSVSIPIGGGSAAGQLLGPQGMCVDAVANVLYVCEEGNRRVSAFRFPADVGAALDAANAASSSAAASANDEASMLVFVGCLTGGRGAATVATPSLYYPASPLSSLGAGAATLSPSAAAARTGSASIATGTPSQLSAGQPHMHVAAPVLQAPSAVAVDETARQVWVTDFANGRVLVFAAFE